MHIETPRSAGFNAAENTRLAEVMHLATQLGGQVASVPAESALEGLKQFTTDAKATQLVVGKSNRSRWFELRHGSVVDRLVRGTPGVAVHVLPMTSAASASKPDRPARREGWGTPSGYAASLALVAAVTLLGRVIFAQGNITNIGLLYFVPVMVAATRFGLRNGIVTGLVSSLAYNFFFIPPTHTFTIQNPENILTVLVLLGVAVVSSQLAARVRAQALLAQKSAAQNSSLAGFARLLTGIAHREELARVLCAEIGRLLDVHVVLMVPDEGELRLQAAWPPNAAGLEMLDLAAARWAWEHRLPAGRSSDTLTASEWLFHPISAGERVLAVIGLARADAGAPVRSDQLPMMLSLLDQAGLALERVTLEEEMAIVAHIRERDRLRAALLSSVSHDLRTPLTTILGMLAEMQATSPEQAQQLAATRTEAERLHRFVGNLLDMVRIESGSLRQTIEPVDLAEAVASAVHDIRRALEGHPVRLDIAPDLPFVMVDPQLFHHCLLNLLENAAKYGNALAPIAVSARRDPSGLTLQIMDEGPGIPIGEEARIFETFARIEGSDRKGGTGLGLAIVKGFAEAMGLTVTAANRQDRQGACFSIRFGEAQLRVGQETP